MIECADRCHDFDAWRLDPQTQRDFIF